MCACSIVRSFVCLSAIGSCTKNCVYIWESAWVIHLCPYVCMCNACVCNFSNIECSFFPCTTRRFLRFRFNSILFQNHIIHSVTAHYSQIKLVDINVYVCVRCGAYLFKMIYGYDFHPLFFDWIHIQLALFSELPGCYELIYLGFMYWKSEKTPHFNVLK